MARIDSIRNFRFRLEIGGVPRAGFSEMAFGATTPDAIDYRDQVDPAHVRKLSKLTWSTKLAPTRRVS